MVKGIEEGMKECEPKTKAELSSQLRSHAEKKESRDRGEGKRLREVDDNCSSTESDARCRQKIYLTAFVSVDFILRPSLLLLFYSSPILF